jgi:hypothetical protein
MNPYHFSESLGKVFRVKNTYFSDADPGPGIFWTLDPGSRMEKLIWDKHPGSATLLVIWLTSWKRIRSLYLNSMAKSY